MFWDSGFSEWKAVNKDRQRNSTQRFPGELRTTRPDGQIDVLHVKLGTRGIFRLMPRNCDFPPLRVEFVKDEVGDRPMTTTHLSSTGEAPR